MLARTLGTCRGDSRVSQTNGRPAANGPLSGFRVIDLTINVLGPLATQHLGDLGAEVIKIEEPGGDYTRHVGPARSPAMGAFFLNLNRNKKSVVLNLKEPEARDHLMALVATADVFVHSMRASAARRLGSDYQQIQAVNPRIVYAWAGGFRPGSSLAEAPAFDDVIQARCGLSGMIGRVTGRPGYLPTVLADKFCGNALASAIGMALLWRERTGEGQEVHVPMLDSMVALNMPEHLWGATLREPEQGVGYLRMFTPNRRPYATRDGHIAVMANNDAQYRRLYDAIGKPDLAPDPRFAITATRARNIDILYGIVAEAVALRTTAEWNDLFAQADIPHGPVYDLADLLTDPYLDEVGFFREMDHPTEGSVVAMDITTSFSASPGRIRSLAPRLGEHTEEILAAASSRDDTE